MSKIFQIVLALIMILFATHANAQKKKADKRLNDEMEKTFGKTVTPPKECKAAETLVLKAIEALKNGEVINADSLINQSIKLYPTNTVFQYVKEVCRMPDINKANDIMDNLYEAVKSFPAKSLIMKEPLAMTFEDGKMVKGIREYEKERALFNTGYDIFMVNKEFGSITRAIVALKKILELDIKNTTTPTHFDYEYAQVQSSRLTLAIFQNDYEKAISLVEEMPVTNFFLEDTKKMFRIWVYQEQGEYNKALQLLNTGDTLPAGLKLKFIAYAQLGKNEAAIENYNMFRQSPYFSMSNDLYYYLAIVDINKKNYTQALINLDSSLTKKFEGMLEGMETLFIDKWKVYKLMGDAYAGLQQFEKAKDNYTISLLSYPDYKPAITALANLESVIAKGTLADKIPPVINLLEPSPQRGLIVTSTGTTAMIKGLATDPSGIKAVTINGQPVYSQPGGDFWGEVTLKTGLNKVSIAATDAAGNKSQQVFEIEKKSGESIVQKQAKEGKNYALLIAAQNYTDNNIPSLDNPVADAVKLKLIFKNQYNYSEANIITLFNPAVNDVKRQLLELTNIILPEDNLVIFYAGHGLWVEKEKKGYWMLIDAKLDNPTTWLPNKVVLDLIAKLPARHTLLITDACFSGSVFKTRGLDLNKKEGDTPSVVQQMNQKISRVAITSGNDTEVPDKSVFMKYLVKALSENKEKFLTAQKMFINQIIEAVMTETKTEPRYGTLELAGHVGGDFIFTKK